MVKTINLLTVLVGITLLLTLANLYGTFSLSGQVGSITGKITELEADGGEPSPQPSPQPSGRPSDQGDSGSPTVEVSEDDDPVKGSEDAPVVIIEFSDFQCPFCKRFYSQTLSQIEEEYVQTGKARLVYRDFPLSQIHPNAQKAAEAAECADDQGKFWEYHDTLFEDQNGWSSVGESKFKEYASDLGLDTQKFNSCLDSGKYRDEVQNDLRDGQNNGVSGTPSFFINGKKVVGAQPFSTFQQAIESEL